MRWLLNILFNSEYSRYLKLREKYPYHYKLPLNDITNNEYVGTVWNKRAYKWMSRICINKQQIYLGLFEDEMMAGAAYLMAKNLLEVT